MLNEFIDSNYEVACRTQRSFVHDVRMQKMLARKQLDKKFVRDWMRGYGLFQGIPKENRRKIVDVYEDHIVEISGQADHPSETDIEKMFSDLLLAFYQVVPRKWISAASKLLWCSFPYDIAIYDAFVHRSLIVLQGVTPYLVAMPRLGNGPRLKSEKDIPALVNFYMNYRAMIVAIQAHHQHQLNELRGSTSEGYAYDIRILDKLLWLLGGPGQPIMLGETFCT